MAAKRVSEINASNSEYMTLAQFRMEIIPWSTDTIKAYVQDEGLPAVKTKNGLIFPRKAVQEWFKRREVRPG